MVSLAQRFSLANLGHDNVLGHVSLHLDTALFVHNLLDFYKNKNFCVAKLSICITFGWISR